MADLVQFPSSQIDRRQFAKVCTEFVISASDFFEELDNLVFRFGERKITLSSVLQKNCKESATQHLFKWIDAVCSSIMRVSDHQSALSKERCSEDNLLFQCLQKLKIDMWRLQLTAKTLRNYFKTNKLSIDSEILLRLHYRHCSGSDKNFLNDVLTSDKHDFSNIITKYIREKALENAPVFDQYLTNKPLFDEIFQEIRDNKLDLSAFSSSGSSQTSDNKQHSTNFLQKYILDETTSSINQSYIRQQLEFDERIDKLIDNAQHVKKVLRI